MLEITNLFKKFKLKNKNKEKVDKLAVKNLSLAINTGEIFGLLGPNGAGKTTTLRMMTMLTRASAGEITVEGENILADPMEYKKIIGMVPQHINFDQDLTVWENLELHGRLHHMPKEERHQRIAELLAYVDLQDRGNDKVKSLSGGMKRRLLIIRGLMHRPKILFLDEPTVALDPQVRRKIWDLIRSLPQQGVTVVITTHYIEEAEQLCNRVAIMNKGELIKLDTPANLCKEFGAYVGEWDKNNRRQYKFFATAAEAKNFQANLGAELNLRPANLEDVFVELTGMKVKE